MTMTLSGLTMPLLLTVVPAAAVTSRSLADVNFDSFQNYCQTEFGLFQQCLTILPDAQACSDCYGSFIGRDLIGTVCSGVCVGDGFNACTIRGIAILQCTNDKIFQYHCRKELKSLKDCGQDDCSSESQDLQECLDAGVKLLRGRDMTTCNEKVDSFESCLEGAEQDIQESCKLCYSDLAFGIQNTTDSCLSCSICAIEGSQFASCVDFASLTRCQTEIAGLIQCRESKEVCFTEELALNDCQVTFVAPNITGPSFEPPEIEFNISDIDIPDLAASSDGNGRHSHATCMVLFGASVLLSVIH